MPVKHEGQLNWKTNGDYIAHYAMVDDKGHKTNVHDVAANLKSGKVEIAIEGKKVSGVDKEEAKKIVNGIKELHERINGGATHFMKLESAWNATHTDGATTTDVDSANKIKEFIDNLPAPKHVPGAGKAAASNGPTR